MLLQEWRAVLSTVCLVLAYGKFAWPWSGLRVTLFPPDAEWVADDPSAWRLALVMCCALPLFAVFRYLQRLATTKKPEHRLGQRKKFRVSAAVAVAWMLLRCKSPHAAVGFFPYCHTAALPYCLATPQFSCSFPHCRTKWRHVVRLSHQTLHHG